MSLGNLTISGTPTYVSGLSGWPMYFETVQLDPSGHTIDRMLEVQEELSDVGINGRRWRRINKQFRPFQMRTTFNSAGSYANACDEQANYYLSIGNIGDLTVSLSATTYKWKNVKVLDVVPQLFRGNMVGSGISSSVAVIVADWTIVLSKQSGHA